MELSPPELLPARRVRRDRVLPDRHRVRPRSSARSISSRYGSHALAPGARPRRGAAARSVDTSALVAGFGRSESVDTSPEIAGFDLPESVDTSGVVAGFGGQTRGRPPRRRTGMPAACK